MNKQIIYLDINILYFSYVFNIEGSQEKKNVDLFLVLKKDELIDLFIIPPKEDFPVYDLPKSMVKIYTNSYRLKNIKTVLSDSEGCDFYDVLFQLFEKNTIQNIGDYQFVRVWPLYTYFVKNNLFCSLKKVRLCPGPLNIYDIKVLGELFPSFLKKFGLHDLLFNSLFDLNNNPENMEYGPKFLGYTSFYYRVKRTNFIQEFLKYSKSIKYIDDPSNLPKRESFSCDKGSKLEINIDKIHEHSFETFTDFLVGKFVYSPYQEKKEEFPKLEQMITEPISVSLSLRKQEQEQEQSSSKENENTQEDQILFPILFTKEVLNAEEKQREKKFRINARNLFLTYSNVNPLLSKETIIEQLKYKTKDLVKNFIIAN